jgi:hypothetical protein
MPYASKRFALVLGLALSLAGTAAFADPPAPVASTDTNTSGVSADVVECKRKEGVLTLKIRLKNGNAGESKIDVIRNRNYDAYYLTAGSKKYFILRDSEKTPLAPETDPSGGVTARMPAGGTYTWWAKFPAPPADVKSVNVYTPIAPPIDDVPISDA